MDIVYPPPSFPFSLKEYPINPFHIKSSAVWDTIYTRNMIERYHMRFTHSINEDISWSLTAMTNADTIIYVHEALYIYRQYRVGSILHNASKLDLEQCFTIYFRNYIDCMQTLLQHKHVQNHKDHVYEFIIQNIYRLKGTTQNEYVRLLDCTKEYLPYTIYKALQKKIRKKQCTRIAQWFFSVTQDPKQKRKLLTCLGMKIYLS